MSLFFHHTRNLFLVSCEYTLDFYRIRYTCDGFGDFPERHSGYPLLLSLKGFIGQCFIKRTAVRKEDNSSADCGLPFMCTVKRSLPSFSGFSFFTGVSDGKVTQPDSFEHRFYKESLFHFEEVDKGPSQLWQERARRIMLAVFLTGKGGSGRFNAWFSVYDGCFILSFLFEQGSFS